MASTFLPQLASIVLNLELYEKPHQSSSEKVKSNILCPFTESLVNLLVTHFHIPQEMRCKRLAVNWLCISPIWDPFQDSLTSWQLFRTGASEPFRTDGRSFGRVVR